MPDESDLGMEWFSWAHSLKVHHGMGVTAARAGDSWGHCNCNQKGEGRTLIVPPTFRFYGDAAHVMALPMFPEGLLVVGMVDR